jgi:hypothetical protein
MLFSLLPNGDVKIFSWYGECCLTYVILLNDYIFTSAQRWCENIFLMSSYVNQFNNGLHKILVYTKP